MPPKKPASRVRPKNGERSPRPLKAVLEDLYPLARALVDEEARREGPDGPKAVSLADIRIEDAPFAQVGFRAALRTLDVTSLRKLIALHDVGLSGGDVRWAYKNRAQSARPYLVDRIGNSSFEKLVSKGVTLARQQRVALDGDWA